MDMEGAMNPHEAYDYLMNDPYVGPASQEAAKKLFNAYRKQLFRRQRQKKAARELDEAIARKNDRIALLESILHRIIYEGVSPRQFRGILNNASGQHVEGEREAAVGSEQEEKLRNDTIQRLEAEIRRAEAAGRGFCQKSGTG